MVDRATWRPPAHPARPQAAGVVGALGGSRLFEQPHRRAEAERLRAFVGEGPVSVEIGFDHGLSLLSAARAWPERRWLGLEIRRRRVEAVAAVAPPNCLPFRGDARTVFAGVLPPACIEQVDVLFPTPALRPGHLLWTDGFVADLARCLRPGGVLRVRTDVPVMAEAVGALLAGWAPAQAPPPAPEPSRRERLCRRDGLPIYEIVATPAG